MHKYFGPGFRVCTLKGETDTDHNDNERTTPAGTWGWVSQLNHTDDKGVRSWDVLFPNGGSWVVLTDTELADAEQYKLAEPNSVHELALWLEWAPKHYELTLMDDAVLPFVSALLHASGEIAKLTNPFKPEPPTEASTMPLICAGWNRRASQLELPRKGAKRAADQEAYMQGALQALHCAGVLSADRMSQIGFTAMIGRLDEYVQAFAAKHEETQP